MTLVSVIIPTFDRPEYVRAAARSVSQQTHEPIELVVVDDHSPTPVEPAVREAVDGSIHRTRVLRHEENRGAAAARNTGVEAAEERIEAFLDDDDRWTPAVASHYVATFADADEAVGLVSVGARNVDGSGRTIGSVRPRVHGDALESVARGARIGSFSRFAVKAAVVDEAGPIDESLPVWQDLEWHCRLAAHCAFATVPELLVERCIGDHDQLTDRYEVRRDVAYPTIRDRHRPTMAARGRWLERQFMGRLTRGLGCSALTTGRRREAMRCFLRSITFDPTRSMSYAYLALALVGPRGLPLVQRCYRALQRTEAG